MMLANNDLGVHAELARPPQNLDHASRRRRPTSRISHQLHIHHRAIQLRQMRQSPPAPAAFTRIPQSQFFPQRCRQLLPRRNFNLMLNPVVIGQHHISPRPVSKQSHHRRMRSPQHAHNPPFRPLPAARTRHPEVPTARFAHPLQSRQHVIPVHRIFNKIPRNKHVSIQLRHRHIRHHKSVSVVVQHQPPPHFIARQPPRTRICVPPNVSRKTCPCRTAPPSSPRPVARLFLRFPLRQPEPPPRHLLNRPSLL